MTATAVLRSVVRGLALAGALAAAACSPARFLEASRVLADIDAGFAPSTLKETTPAPSRNPVAFSVDGRPRAGDLYLPGAHADAGLVLVPGITREGKDDPRLIAFASTLSRARFEVLVPNLPNLSALKVSADNAGTLADALRFFDDRPTSARLGMAAISYAVGPAVAALFEDGADARADFVVAIGGYYDIEATLTFFTTGHYRTQESQAWRHRPPNDYGKWVFVRANVDRLESAADRTTLWAMAERKLDDLQADVADLAARLGAEGRSVYALLLNDDPDRVPALIAALPPVVAAEIACLDLSRLPLERLDARFVLVHGRDDPIILETESMAVGAGRARLYLVDSLDHVDPKPAGLVDRLVLLRAIAELLEIRDEGA
jgi:hypothetical protein